MEGCVSMTQHPLEDANAELIESLIVNRDIAYRVACRALGTGEGAEDVVQQASLDAFRVLQAGFSPRNLRPWFLGIVVNHALKTKRDEQRLHQRENCVERKAYVAELPDLELVEILQQSVARLDQKQRVAIALCYEEGLSQREAAETMGLPLGTLATHVNRALGQLREALKQAGYSAEPSLVIALLAATPKSCAPAGMAAALSATLSASPKIPTLTNFGIKSAAQKAGWLTTPKLAFPAMVLLGAALAVWALALQAQPRLPKSAPPVPAGETKDDAPAPVAAPATEAAKVKLLGAPDILAGGIICGVDIERDKPILALACCGGEELKGGVELWDMKTTRRLASVPVNGEVSDVHCLPDGDVLIAFRGALTTARNTAGSGGAARLDPMTGKVRWQYPYENTYGYMAVSKDLTMAALLDTRMMFKEGRMVPIVDTYDGHLITELINPAWAGQGKGYCPSAAGFSDDGTRLVIACESNEKGTSLTTWKTSDWSIVREQNIKVSELRDIRVLLNSLILFGAEGIWSVSGDEAKRITGELPTCPNLILEDGRPKQLTANGRNVKIDNVRLENLRAGHGYLASIYHLTSRLPALIDLADGVDVFASHSEWHKTIPQMLSFTGDGILVVGCGTQLVSYRTDGTVVWKYQSIVRTTGKHGAITSPQENFTGLQYTSDNLRDIGSPTGWFVDTAVKLSPKEQWLLTVGTFDPRVVVQNLADKHLVWLNSKPINAQNGQIILGDVAWNEVNNRVAIADISAVPYGKTKTEGEGFSGIFSLADGKPARFTNAKKQTLPEAQQVRARPGTDELFVRCAKSALICANGPLVRDTNSPPQPHRIEIARDHFAMHRFSDGTWLRDVANPGMEAVFSSDGKTLVGTLGVVDVENGKLLRSFEKLPILDGARADASGQWSGRWPSPAGTYIACIGPDRTISIYRTVDLNLVCQWTAKDWPNGSATPWQVAWHPEENWIAISFTDAVSIALTQLPVPPTKRPTPDADEQPGSPEHKIRGDF